MPKGLHAKFATWFLIAAIAVVPLLMSGDSSDPILPIQWLALSILGVAGIFWGWRTKAVTMDQIRTGPAIAWLLLIAVGIPSSFFAIVPRYGFLECIRLLVITAFWLSSAAAIQRIEEPSKWISVACSLALIAIGGIAIAQSQGMLTWIPGFKTIPTSTMGNANFLGAAMSLLIPGAVLGVRVGRWKAALSVLAVGVGLYAMVLARSTAPWIGLGAGVFVGLFYLLAKYLLKGKETMSFWLRTAVLGVGILIVAGLGSVVLKSKLARLPASISTSQDSGEERLLMWKTSLEIIADRPMLGCGPDNWNYAAIERGLVGNDQGFATRYFMQAHNDYLQVFSEYGVLGGLAFVCFLGLVWWRGWRRQRTENDREEVWLSAAGMAGLTAWMVNAVVSFPFHRPYLVALLFLWVAVLGRSGAVAEGNRNFVLKPSTIVLLLACLTFAIWNALQMRASHDNFRLHEAKERQNWTEVVRLAEKAETWYNHDDGISKTPLSWYKGNALLNLQRNAEALKALEQAHAQYPSHPMVLGNYAVALALNEKVDEGIEVLEGLLKKFPVFDEARINLTSLYLSQKNWDKARVAIRPWEGQMTNPTINALRQQLDAATHP